MQSSQVERITIIPRIHGKRTRDGKMSEPDIYFILEKWLERHPEVKGRQPDIRISGGYITLPEGIKTEVLRVSILAGPEIEGYDPTQDAELYKYYLEEEQGNTP